MKNYFVTRQTGEEGGQGSNFYYFRRIKPEAGNLSSLTTTPALLLKKKKAATKTMKIHYCFTQKYQPPRN